MERAGDSGRRARGAPATGAAPDELVGALGRANADAGAIAADGLADPDALRRALVGAAAGTAVLVRATRVSADATGGGAPRESVTDASQPAYAPDPIAPVWLRIHVGSAAIGAPSNAGADRGRTETAARVDVERTSLPCCASPACSRRVERAAAALALHSGERLVVAEALAGSESAAGRVIEAARVLARALSIPCDAPAAERAAEEPADAPRLVEAASQDRFAAGFEGDRWVVRDLVSAGPRATARQKLAIGIGMLAVAAFPWVRAAAAVAAGQKAAALGYAAAAAVITLAGYGFIGVARFSAKYAARSYPLLAIGAGRLIVRPWVSRTGAVDRRYEGSYGAAIGVDEITAVAVRPRGDVFAVELDSDHGPIDALVDRREDVATFWSDVVRRVLAEAAHPTRRVSARQRARMAARRPEPGAEAESS